MSKGLEELNKIKKLDILYDIEMTENGEEYMKSNEIDLTIIEKELKDFEWLKSKINIDFFYSLPSDDKLKLIEIMGIKYEQ